MNSPVVVDTHIVIWDRLAPDKLSEKARKAITDADSKHNLVISEISVSYTHLDVYKRQVLQFCGIRG